MSSFLAAAHEVGALCSRVQFHSSGCLWRLGWPLPLSPCCCGQGSTPQGAVARTRVGTGTCWVPQPHHPGASAVSILVVPLLGNEANSTVGSRCLPSPGARVSLFSHAVLYPQAFSVCCFSAGSLCGFHLSLKEKEKQSSFNGCYYDKLPFSHCSLFQPNSKKPAFSFNSSLCSLPVRGSFT